MWRVAVLLVVGLGAVVAQHPTNQCTGPLPVGTDLSTLLASGQRNLVRPRTLSECACARGYVEGRGESRR